VDYRSHSVLDSAEEVFDLIFELVLESPSCQVDGVLVKDVFHKIQTEVLKDVIKEPLDLDSQGWVRYEEWPIPHRLFLD
jgi:hypothetical protein